MLTNFKFRRGWGVIFALMVFFTTAASAWVCMSNSFTWPAPNCPPSPAWLNAWCSHSGPLPNGVMSHWDYDTWGITSSLGGAGNQTVSGDINCSGDWDSNVCSCRMTSPHVGQWVSIGDAGDHVGCVLGCSYLCAQCVLDDAFWGISCRRSDIFN